MAGEKLSSFPVTGTSQYVLDLYGEVAEAYPEGFPPLTSGPLQTSSTTSATWVRRSPSLLQGDRKQVLEHERPPGEQKKARQWHYVDLREFPADGQRRVPVWSSPRRTASTTGRARASPPAQDPPPPPPKPPEFDFHGYVAFSATTRSCCDRSASRSTCS